MKIISAHRATLPLLLAPVIFSPLTAMGASFVHADGRLPLTITGAALRATTIATPIASAQVKSALLLAGLHLFGRQLLVVVLRQILRHSLPEPLDDGFLVDRMTGGEANVLVVHHLDIVEEDHAVDVADMDRRVALPFGDEVLDRGVEPGGGGPRRRVAEVVLRPVA